MWLTRDPVEIFHLADNSLLSFFYLMWWQIVFWRCSPPHLPSHMFFHNVTLPCSQQEVRSSLPLLESMWSFDLLVARRMWWRWYWMPWLCQKGHGALAWCFWDTCSGEAIHHGSGLPIPRQRKAHTDPDFHPPLPTCHKLRMKKPF